MMTRLSIGVRALLSATIALIALCAATPALAQYGDLNLETNAVWITLDPLYPHPGEAVHLKVESPLLDLSTMQITWSVGETVLAQGKGLVDVDFKADALGTDTTLTMTAASASSSVTKTVRVVPTDIDLLYESDSYVPPFFLGRALPFAGSHIIVQAIPRFVRPDGSLVPSDSIKFTWRLNGVTMNALSGKGKSFATFPAPTLFGTNTISLEASTEDGIHKGTATMNISSGKPYVALYVDHPLFGVLYDQSLSSDTALPGSETTFLAVPYYSNVSDPRGEPLRYDWRVDGKTFTPEQSAQNEATIHPDIANQRTTIGLDLTHDENPFLSLTGEWNVTLSGNSSSASGESSDPFHQQ